MEPKLLIFMVGEVSMKESFQHARKAIRASGSDRCEGTTLFVARPFRSRPVAGGWGGRSNPESAIALPKSRTPVPQDLAQPHREAAWPHQRLHQGGGHQKSACRSETGQENKKMLKMKDDPDELLKNKWTKIVSLREPDELLKTHDLLENRMSYRKQRSYLKFA
jgi:hypothetical protein